MNARAAMHDGLLSKHEDDALVAFGAQGTRTALDLLSDAARIAERLPEPREDTHVLFVFRQDLYALAASLLATCARGHTLALPPELSRNAITELAASKSTAYVLHDTRSGLDLRVPDWLEQAPRASPLSRSVLAGRVLRAVRFAYDASGDLLPQPESHPWLVQAARAARLVGLRPGQLLYSTVGGAHPFGIVCGLLSSLLSGAAFARDALSPATPRLDLPSGALPTAILTVPVHLEALLDTLSRRQPDAGATNVHVVSGFAPLSADDRAALSAHGVGKTVDLFAEAPEDLPLARGAGADPSESSLRALEAALRKVPGVRDTALLSVASDDAPLLAAVVGERLDEAALQQAVEGARPGASVSLLRLGRIRRDSVGTFDRNELLAQFGLKPDGSPRNLALTWGQAEVVRNADRTTYRRTLTVPADYAYFDGHFPGYPILPGAAQLSELVLPCVREVRPERTRLVEMTRLKFSGRIKPGEEITVELTFSEGTGAIDFVLRRGTTLCSSGTLEMMPEEAE